MYAPVPQNYFCKACGMQNDHWIMQCSYKTSLNHRNQNISKQQPSILSIDGKSNAWNASRSQSYELIYDSITKSPFCSDRIYQKSIGIIPDIIIHHIAFYTISCCNVLSCDGCKNEINSYLFEQSNKANDEICDYYLSDDYEENDKVFCNKCITNDFIVGNCPIITCKKIDKRYRPSISNNNAFTSNWNRRSKIPAEFNGLRCCNLCEENYCSRHDISLWDKCNTCLSRFCPNCEKYKYEYGPCSCCGNDICYGCKSCCQGCDGTDSCHDCWIHKECVERLSKCGICDRYFCESWWDDCKHCEQCEAFIDVNCVPYPWKETNRLLCNKCKDKQKLLQKKD